MSEGAIRKRIGPAKSVYTQCAHVREAAQLVADANVALEALPLGQRQVAINLADELRAVSTHLAAAARFGSATAHRLAAVAHAQVAKMDDAEPMSEESVTALKTVSALTRLANDAAQTGLVLLKANEDAIRDDAERARQQATRVTRVEIVPMQPKATKEDRP